MSALLPSIELDVRSKLNEQDYRRSFFLAESSALIAKQLIALRKRRGLNQTELAEALDTGQPAISRIERADYRNWSFNTLRRAAEAMDARLRVYIEPAEDVLHEYESEADTAGLGSAASAESEDQTVRKAADDKRASAADANIPPRATRSTLEEKQEMAGLN